MSWAIGIDVGGTFTDVVVTDAAGASIFAKAATTPQDQSEGVLEGIALAAAALGLTCAALLAGATRVVHGMTVATNALLERKLARTAMLITEGHRDVVAMREGLKPARYDLRMPPPGQIVPRRLRFAVRERMRADGSVETPLDTAAVEAVLTEIESQDIESIAICLLHAWRNPAHEQAVAAAVRGRLPGVYVSASSDVLPAIKEFERFATTVANAAVGPLIEAYLGRLQSRLAEAGYAGALFVTLSHGGVASVEEASRLAAGTALSGPAGGVAAAIALARQGLADDLITFDMGGTSTDIALVQGGRAALSAGREIGDARIALPSLDIVTLGAGGGSIARRDPAGLLQVGPHSAGADPGPACYGRGGTEPTVTDANLCLGYLDAGGFLGGRRRLDVEAARAAVARLGASLGIDSDAAAAGIYRLVNTRMADGVRIATVRRGVDPRRQMLLAFGGAAGLHVAAVAAELGIVRVAVPANAAVLSAWGMLNTDLRLELMRSQSQSAGMDTRALAAAFADMEAEGRARLDWFDGEVTVARSADMRYGEQVFEIAVPLDGLDWESPDLAAQIAEAFHRRHEALYTYAMRDQDVVLVNARAAVSGHLAAMPVRAPAGAVVDAAPVGMRRIYLDGWRDAPVFDFAALAPDQAIEGPAVIEGETTTVLLRGGDVARYDGRGWLEVSVGCLDP